MPFPQLQLWGPYSLEHYSFHYNLLKIPLLNKASIIFGHGIQCWLLVPKNINLTPVQLHNEIHTLILPPICLSLLIASKNGGPPDHAARQARLYAIISSALPGADSKKCCQTSATTTAPLEASHSHSLRSGMPPATLTTTHPAITKKKAPPKKAPPKKAATKGGGGRHQRWILQ